MRQITKDAIHAFLNNEDFMRLNTEVFVGLANTYLILHGNPIAMNCEGRIRITTSGWKTNVTKERLNGIPGVSIVPKNFEWFLNDKPWDGEWIMIGETNERSNGNCTKVWWLLL